MHRFSRAAVLATLLALALGLSAMPVAAASRVTGHVYVNDNTAGANTVSAFDRHADGSLSLMAGSPFAAGGTGTGTPLGVQGGLQHSADGRYLLVADAGSNQISVLRIKSDGSLMRVDVVSSNGTKPGSIAVHGRLVYVANSGAGRANYTGFTLDAGGVLEPLHGSTFALPDNAFPGDILFSSDGRHVAGVRTGGTPTEATLGPSEIDSFTVANTGRLIPAAGSPFASQQIGPIGSEFVPANSSQLLVTNAHEGLELGSVSSYSVSGSGALAPVTASPFFNGQTATCWIDITHNSAFAFVVNTATPSISSYAIHEDGSLTLLGSTRFRSAVAPEDDRLDPSGSFLYVIDSGGRKVDVFVVSGGNLTELAGSPSSTNGDGGPFGIVVI